MALIKPRRAPAIEEDWDDHSEQRSLQQTLECLQQIRNQRLRRAQRHLRQQQQQMQQLQQDEQDALHRLRQERQAQQQQAQLPWANGPSAGVSGRALQDWLTTEHKNRQRLKDMKAAIDDLRRQQQDQQDQVDQAQDQLQQQHRNLERLDWMNQQMSSLL